MKDSELGVLIDKALKDSGSKLKLKDMGWANITVTLQGKVVVTAGLGIGNPNDNPK